MNKSDLIKFFAIIGLGFLISSCSHPNLMVNNIPEMIQPEPLVISLDSIAVEGDLGTFSVKKSLQVESDGLQLITFEFESEQPAELQPVFIRFHFPSIDIHGFWNPKIDADKVNFYSSAIDAKASSYAPILSFYDNALQNRMTFALSDAMNKTEISSYLREEDVNFYPTIRLFQEKLPATTYYRITLRIDTRKLPYYQAIDDVASWWADQPEYKPMHVPESAKQPMYSTWYSYHQNLDAERIVAECRIAKTLGCGAVIVDDGWQTNDGNRGYAYTGDWYPERIPNMKEFVEAVHAEGMKFILWYSLPFMGENAQNYPRFKGKYLRYWESQGTYVLDPRYPEVRQYIVDTYVNALNDWNLDGFKLDFIGRFHSSSDTELTMENGRDFADVNQATDVLMTEITNRLIEINPEILIEFRQPYIGPLMRKYGNMFRGVDAPNNAVANRLETTNLRLLSQNTAVHSDMFIWRKEEPVEVAALQILNILYSVPQLSVRLAEIPEDHLDMIRHWFGYWNRNKLVLMDGDFIPSDPVGNYPYLTAVADAKQITTLYEDVVVEVDAAARQIDVVNAKTSLDVVIKLNQSFDGLITISDCKGEVVFEQQMTLPVGVSLFNVPVSGTLSLQ